MYKGKAWNDDTSIRDSGWFRPRRATVFLSQRLVTKKDRDGARVRMEVGMEGIVPIVCGGCDAVHMDNAV